MLLLSAVLCLPRLINGLFTWLFHFRDVYLLYQTNPEYGSIVEIFQVLDGKGIKELKVAPMMHSTLISEGLLTFTARSRKGSTRSAGRGSIGVAWLGMISEVHLAVLF